MNRVATERDGNPWLTGVAIVGTIASVLAAALMWLVVTRPDAVGMTLGVWLNTR